MEHEVAAEVPQGSILGPFLWNLIYDRLLERLDNMPMVRATAFADDLAITCSVGKNEEASAKVNVMLRIANDWCTSVGLTLAREKTEVMLITRLQVPRVVKLKLGSSDIETVDRIKYLGVIIDTSRRFGAHIETVCNRADKLIGALRGILPNINRPPSLACRLYYNVWESIVTYGVPVWARAANTDKNRKKLKRAQRTALCITTTVYRTVSHAALCALTGNLPIYIKIKMLGETYERNKIHETRIGADVGSKLKEELEAIR